MKRPPEPRPAASFTLPPFATALLPNGLRVRAARWGRRPTVAASLLLPGAGSGADPRGKEGTAEVTAETVTGGTPSRTAREIAEALDDLAAVMDVSAGFDSCVARLYVLESDLEAGLALFAEVFSEAAFPEEEVEKARRRQIDMLREQRSEPDFLARERLLDRLYPGHPYGCLSATETGLSNLTREDVVTHWRGRCTLRGATLVLVGAPDPERMLAAATKVFGSLPSPAAFPNGHLPAPVPVSSFSIHLVNRPGSVQTNLLFARPAIKRDDPRYAAAIVANQSLGGGASARLFHILREERGLTYGAYSSLSPRRDAGHFAASIDCRTEVTHEALSGLLDLIRAFAHEGPTADEHQRSQRFLGGSFALARETPGAIAQDEITRVLHGLPEDEFTTWRSRVAAVAREEARETARTLFDPAVGVLAAVGDQERIRPVLERFGETTCWDADGPRS